MLPSGFHFFERGWLSSNTLLLQNNAQSVVIDTGYVTHANQLLRLIQHQLQGQVLDQVINTHLHSDHCGGNALLQNTFDHLAVHIPASQWTNVHDWSTDALSFDMTGQTCPPFTATHAVSAHQTLELCGLAWSCIPSPGHDDDSFMLYQPDHAVLVSADALWESGFGVVFPEFLGGGGFEGIAFTLDAIEKLNVKMVLPGHGKPFTDVSQSLASARKKLDFYTHHPEKHALYAAKVLLKFKLMEFQQQNLEAFMAWSLSAPLLQTIHQHFYANSPLDTWVESLISQMVERKAMRIDSGVLINL